MPSLAEYARFHCVPFVQDPSNADRKHLRNRIRLDILPSATLDPQHQAMLNQLRSSANFDALYRQQQIAVHRDALALHSAYSTRGASPTLRPVAQAAVAVVQRHLRLLNYL